MTCRTRIVLLLLGIPLTVSCHRSSDEKRAATPRTIDWPMFGGTPSRNMVAQTKGLPFDLDPGEIDEDDQVVLSTTRNVLWAAKLGSQSWGFPTVSSGRVFIGTNIEGRGDPRFRGDYSLLKCLDAKTGKDLWTLTVPKLGSGKVGDWELLGICSSPTVVDDRVYIVTNRCEVLGLDVQGLANGNQGFQDESHYMAYHGPYEGPKGGPPVPLLPGDADIVWRYDMRGELNIYPHNETSSSVLAVGDHLFCSTSNGVTYDHTDIPFPKSPALIMLDRKVAESPEVRPEQILVGEEGSGLSKRILHANWTSPSFGVVDGRESVFFGGPDGVLYAFGTTPVKDEDGLGVLPELWRYDCNPPHYRYRHGDPSKPIKYVKPEGPSEVIGPPVFHEGRVYVTIGQDPEHGEGLGNLSCIDAATGKKIWDTQDIGRSLSSCSVVGDRVYVADYSGYVYCIDAREGKLLWRYDMMAPIWGSTLVADDKLYLGNEDANLTVLSIPGFEELLDELGAPLYVRIRKRKLWIGRDRNTPLREISSDERRAYVRNVEFCDPIAGTPVVADGVLYVATMRHLYAIGKEPE